jgi:hypothetical protein
MGKNEARSAKRPASSASRKASGYGAESSDEEPATKRRVGKGKGA